MEVCEIYRIIVTLYGMPNIIRGSPGMSFWRGLEAVQVQDVVVGILVNRVNSRPLWPSLSYRLQRMLGL